MKKLIVSSICLAFCIAAYAVYKAHKKTIVDGQFLGLSIDSTKYAVFEILVSKKNVSAVSARVPYFIVTQKNAAEVRLLLSVDAFLIHGPKLQITVYNENGEITRFEKYGIGLELSGEWSNMAEFLPALKQYLLRTKGAAVIPIPRTYARRTSDSISAEVSKLASNAEIKWLFDFDHWFFVEDDRWTFIDLHFLQGKLHRIEYQNNFMEVP